MCLCECMRTGEGVGVCVSEKRRQSYSSSCEREGGRLRELELLWQFLNSCNITEIQIPHFNFSFSPAPLSTEAAVQNFSRLHFLRSVLPNPNFKQNLLVNVFC